MLSKSPTIRCRSGGGVRRFFRNRMLLVGWRPRLLPHAPSQPAADGALDGLVGATLRHTMGEALSLADTLAGRIGGCARDAYTILYGCAALAVLFAATGVAIGGHGAIINGLLVAELLTLGVLFVTFRQAHMVNWHGRWLGLRFHAEFLRCLPLLAMLREELTPGWLARQVHAAPQGEEPEHLQVLSEHHHGGHDERAAGHEQRQQQLRDDLFWELHARFLEAPERYAHDCLGYARMLAQQQQRYHCLRAQQEQAIVHRVHTLSIAGFSLTIAAVLLHAWWDSPILTVVSTGVPAFAAALHGFVAQEESERLAANSQSMARSLHQWIADSAEVDDDVGGIQASLSRLVKLMMSEVRDWHRLFDNKAFYHLG